MLTCTGSERVRNHNRPSGLDSSSSLGAAVRHRGQPGEPPAQLAAAAARDRSCPDRVGRREREGEVVPGNPFVRGQLGPVGSHRQPGRDAALRDDALGDLAPVRGEGDRKAAEEGARKFLGPGLIDNGATAGHREHRPDREAAPGRRRGRGRSTCATAGSTRACRPAADPVGLDHVDAAGQHDHRCRGRRRVALRPAAGRHPLRVRDPARVDLRQDQLTEEAARVPARVRDHREAAAIERQSRPADAEVAAEGGWRAASSASACPGGGGRSGSDRLGR